MVIVPRARGPFKHLDRENILRTIREKLKSSLKDANFTDRHLKLKRQNDTKLGTVRPAVWRGSHGDD